jgi:preprotein translocase subunit SecE
MASTEVKTVVAGADLAKLAAASTLLVTGFVAYFMLDKQGPYIQWGALIALVGAALAVFLMSESGRQLVAFGRDSYREVKKVVWPERREAIQMTMYVFGFVFLMSIFLWLTDKTIEWVFYDLILGWKK